MPIGYILYGNLKNLYDDNRKYLKISFREMVSLFDLTPKNEIHLYKKMEKRFQSALNDSKRQSVFKSYSYNGTWQGNKAFVGLCEGVYFLRRLIKRVKFF